MSSEVVNKPSFLPAESGWYFVHPGVKPDDPPVLHRVAVWRVDGEEVTGLIGLQEAKRLVAPPPVEGGYVHVTAMSNALEQALLRQANKQT